MLPIVCLLECVCAFTRVSKYEKCGGNKVSYSFFFLSLGMIIEWE